MEKQLQHIGYGLFLEQTVTIQFKKPLVLSQCYELYTLKRKYFNSAAHIHFDAINKEQILLHGTYLLLLFLSILELCLLRELASLTKRRQDNLFFISTKIKNPSFYFLFHIILVFAPLAVFFYQTANPLSFFFWGLFFLFAYSGLIFLYHQTMHMDEEKLNRHLLEQQISLYEQEFQAIQHSQNQIHSLRHDWSNHLMLLSEYIYDQKYSEAQEYISQLKETIHGTYNYSNTGNYDVDCILNYYLAKAEECGCILNTSLSIPAETFLSGFDLNILLSNLLENALEALSHSQEKKLDICLRYEKNLFYVSIYNTFQAPVYPNKTFFKTTKKDSNMHGYGFQNMNNIIDKYNGTSSFRVKGNLFMADIILPNE